MDETLPSNEQADQLLAAQQIDPNTHALIVQANNAAAANQGLSGAAPPPPAPVVDAAPAGVGGMPQPAPTVTASGSFSPDTSNFMGGSSAPAQNFSPMDGGGAVAVPPPTKSSVAPLGLAGMPNRTVKLGETSDVTESKSAGPKAEEAFNKYVAAHAESQAAQADLDREDAKYKALEINERSGIRARRILDEEQRQAEISRHVRTTQQEIDRVTNEFNNAKVDSNRVYGDGQTGNKIMAAIGLALGALSEGLTGKDAGVVDIIQKAIERDIDVQKANIAKMGDSIKFMRGGLQSYMQIMKDEGAAKDLEMARQMDQVADTFAKIRANSPDAAIRARSAESETVFRQKSLEFRQATDVVTQKHAEKTTDQVLKREGYSEGTKTTVNSSIKALRSLDKIEELFQKVGTGPMADYSRRLKGALGMNSADEQEFQATLKSMEQDLVHQLSGATASDDERAQIAQQLMRGIDNPEAFRRMLDVVREKTLQGVQDERTSALSSNRYDPAPGFDQYMTQRNNGKNSSDYRRMK